MRVSHDGILEVGGRVLWYFTKFLVDGMLEDFSCSPIKRRLVLLHGV